MADDNDGEGDDNAEDQKRNFPRVKDVLLIFTVLETNRVRKLRSREVNAIALATPITFDRADHPTHALFPGRQALIVDPLVNGFRLRNVLMDGGSGLNILYASTLDKMGIPKSGLNTTRMNIHGVVQGSKPSHWGEVIFGGEHNFQNTLSFEVVDFKSEYHNIFGRPTYAKFIARSCYVYLKLKMPSPKGVITVAGNLKLVEDIVNKNVNIVDPNLGEAKLAKYKLSIDLTKMPKN